MAFQVTWKEKGAIFNFSGSISIQEINKASEPLQGDAKLDDHTYSIWNFLEADLSSITEIEANEPASIASAVAISVPEMKVALIAQENHAVELCKYVIESTKKFGSTWEFHLFDCMDDAIKWGES